jgi:pimeloyl-ACP methyl ester carboxylesterase
MLIYRRKMKLPLLLTTAAILASQSFAAPSCVEMTIPVSISATNVQLPAQLSVSGLLSFVSLSISQLVNLPIKGTYEIFAKYCTPEVYIQPNRHRLQFLVHGAARDHHYWDGYSFEGTPHYGANYSWVHRASLLGYPTLSIDRLGNGLSAHPNPNDTVQLPAQVEVSHAVIKAVKSGVLNTSFSEITYVGHSYGSLIGQVYASKYPSDFQRMILTGWSSLDYRMLFTASSVNSTAPARIVDAERFGNLDYGYMESTNVTHDGAQTYYGYDLSTAGQYYDPGLPSLAFIHRGTSATGEGLSQIFIAPPSPQYTGDVLALTGQNDAYWCGSFSQANCGVGNSSTVARAKSVFPNAKSYSYYVPAHTGHEWNYHHSQKDSFDAVFAWMEN